jgi:hypothetical protein
MDILRAKWGFTAPNGDARFNHPQPVLSNGLVRLTGPLWFESLSASFCVFAHVFGPLAGEPESFQCESLSGLIEFSRGGSQ